MARKQRGRGAVARDERAVELHGSGRPVDRRAVELEDLLAPRDLGARGDELQDLLPALHLPDEDRADEPVGAIADDQRPFPVDTVVVGAAAVLGAVAGAAFGKRPGRDAALGALGGVIGAAVARRIWRLP
jgi:hypothetical protein